MAYIDIYNDTSSSCLICGESLIYPEGNVKLNCFVCGKEVEANEHCTSNHAVCTPCRLGSGYEVVKAFCLNSKTTDPNALAIDIMNSPLIKMHGAEHHFIVPAVLLTAVHNKTSNPANLKESLELAAEKAMKVPTTCTFNQGTCGAAMGSGIFLEVYTGRDDMTDEKFSLPNNLTAESLQQIDKSPGPQCCKRDTYISIEEGIKFLSERFAIDLDASLAKCTFSLRNRTCGHEDCNYYNVGLSMV